MEVAAIELANRKEQEEFEEQMSELGKMLESELRLPTPMRFASIKSQPTADNATVQSSVPGEEDLNASANKVLLPSSPGNKSSWAIEKLDAQASYERVQNFEDAFNKIKAATGITDIDELV
eukprot:gene20081-25465_t